MSLYLANSHPLVATSCRALLSSPSRTSEKQQMQLLSANVRLQHPRQARHALGKLDTFSGERVVLEYGPAADLELDDTRNVSEHHLTSSLGLDAGLIILEFMHAQM